MTITQSRIDALAARLTPADADAIASDWRALAGDWRAVGDDLRAAIDEAMPTPKQVIVGWLWAYQPIRKAFAKADVAAIAWDLVTRLQRHGYRIEGAPE